MRVKTGTYTGNGAASQAIVGVGFTPLSITIFPRLDDTLYNIMPMRTLAESNVRDAMYWYETLFGFAYGNNDHILSHDADGFTVGDGTGFNNVFNINLRVYTYVCIG